jgi:hypothetical protein
MDRLHNAWRPMLLGALLMLVLVGVAGAVPTKQPTSALSTQRKIVISAGEFLPADSNVTFSNHTSYLYTLQNNVDLGFIAPVDFPTHRKVVVDRVELHARDTNPTGRIRLHLFRTTPSTGATIGEMAYIDTGIAYTYPSPRTWQDTSISPNVKWPTQDCLLFAWISDDSNLLLNGATIYYRVAT